VRGAFVFCVALIALAACTEKPQTAGTRKSDDAAWAATDNAFNASGFKANDQAGWDEQMKRRAQGQNEYVRNAPR
jgi:hypothetical protein